MVVPGYLNPENPEKVKIENQRKRRKKTFVSHVSKMKRFHDQETADGEGSTEEYLSANEIEPVKGRKSEDKSEPAIGGANDPNLRPKEKEVFRQSTRANNGKSAASFIIKVGGKANRSSALRGGRNWWSAPDIARLFLGAMILCMMVGKGFGLKLDIQDCTRPQYAGTISCSKPAQYSNAFTQIRLTPVTFTLFIERRDSRTFSGQRCRVWERVKRIKQGVIWNTSTTSHEIH